MENQGTKKNRIWELDFLRGIALILMVYFHIVYDLKEFYQVPISYDHGMNFYIGKASAIIFMFISGIASALSKSNIKRGLKILALAIVITIVTYMYNPAYYVKFGILHFFSVSMLLSAIFSKLNRYVLLLLAILIIISGSFISEFNATSDFLFPLGITTNSFSSSDYYPLIPWFGVFLLGMSVQKFIYMKKQSIMPFELKSNNPISEIGQHTLLIYMAHQPIIMIVMYFMNLLGII